MLSEFSSSDLRSVGNYTLGRLIGKGSFGKVYLGSHKLIRGSKVCEAQLTMCISAPLMKCEIIDLYVLIIFAGCA